MCMSRGLTPERASEVALKGVRLRQPGVVRAQVDPFFVPVTEEEREEFGEEGQGVGTANLARTLLDEVRRRKGLAVDRKVVESATKQRTRARKV